MNLNDKGIHKPANADMSFRPRKRTPEAEGVWDVFSLEQMLTILVTEAPNYAMAMLDRQGRFTFWNRGAELITGYPENEIVGCHLQTLFVPEDQEFGVPLLELKTALQKNVANNDRWLQKKDGTRFWARGLTTAVRNSHGTIIGFSKLFRDETTRKKTEEELQQTYSHLASFASVVSHDLKEPLRMVASYTELLKRNCSNRLGEDEKESMKFIGEGVARMTALLNNLMSYSLVGNQRVERELVDCNVVVDTIVTHLKQRIEECNGCVTHAVLPQFHAVAVELMEVFQNLITNSLKFQRPGNPPRVWIDAEETETEVSFSVHDNGIGVAAGDQDKIFMEFERVSDRSAFPGTGLGLAICKKIVERHGGRIWVNSELGVGTTFFFNFPK